MRQTCRTLSVCLLASSVAAQVPDYFPLQVGNQWVFGRSYHRQLATDRNGGEYFIPASGMGLFHAETGQWVSADELAELDIIWPGDEEGWEHVQDEFVLDVTGAEELDGETYFRLSTGIHVRRDVQGNVLDGPSRVLFDFADVLELPEKTFGVPTYLFPYVPRCPASAPPERTTSLAPRRTALGMISNIVTFSRPGHTACYISFAPGIGPIAAGTGSDVEFESVSYALLRGHLNGVDLPVSAVERMGWGEVKRQGARPH